MEEKKAGAMLGAVYVRDRKIGELFQTLIASLVCHRPEDPITFLLQNLSELRDEKEVFLSRLHAHVRATTPLLPPLDIDTTKARAHRHARKGKLKTPKQPQSPEQQSQNDKRKVTNLHSDPPPGTSDVFGASGNVTNQIRAQPHMTLPINLLPPLQKSKHRKPPFRTGIIIDKDSRPPLPPSHLNNSVSVNNYTKAKPPIPGVIQVPVSKNDKHSKGEGDTKGTKSVYLTDSGQQLDKKVVGKTKKQKNKEKKKEKRKQHKNKGNVPDNVPDNVPVIFTDLHMWPTPQESLELSRKQEPFCQSHEQKPTRPKTKWRPASQQFEIWFNLKSHRIDAKYLQNFVTFIQTQRLPKRKRQKKKEDCYHKLEDQYACGHARKVHGVLRKRRKKLLLEDMVEDTDNAWDRLLARKKHILEETHYDNAILIRLSPEDNLKRKRPKVQRKKAIRRMAAKLKAAGKERRRLGHAKVDFHQGQKMPTVCRTFCHPTVRERSLFMAEGFERFSKRIRQKKIAPP